MENNYSSTNSFDQLLDSLGFDDYKTLATTFVLPAINLIGTTVCALSVWIFYRRRFVDSVFVYYRLLCLVNVFLLLNNIPLGLFISPRYFPRLNTYQCAMYQMYYGIVSGFLFHFEDLLKMAILLNRMKLFSVVVRRNFKASPRIVSFAFFFTSLCIDWPLFFAFKIDEVGQYFYLDSSNSQKIASFYYIGSSNFSSSPFGRILLGVSIFFLNIFLMLVIGVALNITAYVQYKSYLSQRRQRDEVSLKANTKNGTTIRLSLKERYDRQAEKNMFYMSLTLCSISILSRLLLMFIFIYFFFFSSFSSNLLVLLLIYFIYTFVPFVSIFVFYSFNKMFRQEVNAKFFKRERHNLTVTYAQR
jgi:hypothetical protein